MMNYVENFDILEKKVKQIPCITGQGAPSDTDGAVGLFYMDTNTDVLYKCTATDGNRFIWNPVTTQPNWNQNDETKPDYVKNRTHWVGSGVATLYSGQLKATGSPLPEDYLGAGKYNYQEYLANLIFPDSMGTSTTIPDSFRVAVDGVECNLRLCFDSINSESSLSMYRAMVRKDEYIALGYTNWGRNVLIVYYTEGLMGANLEIFIDGEIYHTLDDRFIPACVVRKTEMSELVSKYVVNSDWDALDTDPGFICNRTHGRVYDLNTVYDEECVSGSVNTDFGYKITTRITSKYPDAIRSNTQGCIQMLQDSSASIGYYGYWFYTCMEGHESSSSTLWVKLGDAVQLLFVLGSAEYDGDGWHWDLSIYSNINLDSYRLKVALNMVYTKALDEEYIPDTIARVSDKPDWLQQDPAAADYIKNRPFYDSINYLTWVEECEAIVEQNMMSEVTEYSNFVLPAYNTDVQPKNGDILLVTIDGVTYEGIAEQIIEVDDVPCIYCNTENFRIYYDPRSGYLRLQLDREANETVVVKVVIGQISCTTIPERFVPKDWCQCDESQSDFIRNRTHYKQSVYEIFHDKLCHWGYENMPTVVNVKTDIPLTVDNLIGARVYMPVIVDHQVYFSTPCYISTDDITTDAEWIYFPYGKVDVTTGTNVVMNVVNMYNFGGSTNSGDWAQLVSIKLEIFNGKKLDSVYLPPEVPLISPAELDELAGMLENAE